MISLLLLCCLLQWLIPAPSFKFLVFIVFKWYCIFHWSHNKTKSVLYFSWTFKCAVHNQRYNINHSKFHMCILVQLRQLWMDLVQTTIVNLKLLYLICQLKHHFDSQKFHDLTSCLDVFALASLLIAFCSISYSYYSQQWFAEY